MNDFDGKYGYDQLSAPNDTLEYHALHLPNPPPKAVSKFRTNLLRRLKGQRPYPRPEPGEKFWVASIKAPLRCVSIADGFIHAVTDDAVSAHFSLSFMIHASHVTSTAATREAERVQLW